MNLFQVNVPFPYSLKTSGKFDVLNGYRDRRLVWNRVSEVLSKYSEPDVYLALCRTPKMESSFFENSLKLLAAIFT